MYIYLVVSTILLLFHAETTIPIELKRFTNIFFIPGKKIKLLLLRNVSTFQDSGRSNVVSTGLFSSPTFSFTIGKPLIKPKSETTCNIWNENLFKKKILLSYSNLFPLSIKVALKVWRFTVWWLNQHCQCYCACYKSRHDWLHLLPVCWKSNKENKKLETKFHSLCLVLIFE